jgi:adenosine deaminase
MEDESIVALARERGTAFEVCITSNYQSGVVESLEAHPLIKLFENGINVTINTDDPSISRITLSHEYYTACEDLHMPKNVLCERIMAAAEAGFLASKEKEKLVAQLKKELKM